MKFIKNEKSISYVVLIFAIILRCINFGTVPAGYHFDELGSAIDAWFIINYGTDRYGISYPVYFINYGGGQSALYTYLCAVSIFILEFNEIAIKLPALLSSILFAVFGMKLIGITFSNYINSSRLQLLFVILYAVSPYCFMSSRFGLDCNFMLGASTVFLYFLVKALRNKKDIYFFISGISAGIVLYTYAISYIVLPLFLFMTLAYLLNLKQISLRNIIIFSIPLTLFAVPLILVQYVNMFDKEAIKFCSVTITKLPVYRISELTFSNIPQNVYLVLKSALAYDWIDYNTTKKFWNFYHISIIFFIAGIISVMRQAIVDFYDKKFSGSAIVLFWFLAEFILGALLGKAGDINANPNANKINGIFISVMFFIIYGMAELFSFKFKLKKIFIGILTIIYLTYASLFFKFYFYDYQPKFIFGVTNDEAIALIKKVEAVQNKSDYEHIIKIFYDSLKKYI